MTPCPRRARRRRAARRPARPASSSAAASGGVGKTTTAAALALRAAERGRRVVVLTIDPARRLAQSLGLTELDNTPRQVKGVDRARRRRSSHAMMLDMKRTFDEVVLAHADPGQGRADPRQPLLPGAVSSSFAGTQEYMAMEKLGQLRPGRSRTTVGPDRRRHPAVPLGAGLPRRARSGWAASSTAGCIRLLAAPARAGGRAYLKVVSAGVRASSPGR